MLAIVIEASGNVNLSVKVNAHHSLELPQAEYHRILRVVNVRNGILDSRLRALVLKFRSLLHVVAHLGLLEIVKRILVNALVNIEGFLGKQNTIEGLFYLGHGLKLG